MPKKRIYSLYEAKTQLSAIVRRVREGESVVVTVHGSPVAEIRPVPAPAESLGDRIRSLIDLGVITPPETSESSGISRVGRKAGALQRFLDDRD